MMYRIETLKTLALSICLSASLHAQSVFQDGFEDSIIKPFWTFYSPGNNGTWLLDTTVAHTGAQSVKLSAQAYGGNAYLTHVFPSPSHGTAEVYVYDPLIYGIGYPQLWISADPQPSWNSYLLWQDWASLSTNLYYPVVDTSTGNINWAHVTLAPPASSPGWRRWSITATATEVTIKIDGATVFTRPQGFALKSVSLNHCCLTGYANFDDFSFIQAPSYQVTLLYDPTKAVKSGATIPIKVEIRDSSGQAISSPEITLRAVHVTKISPSVSGDVQDSGNSNPDSNFRFDFTLGGTGGYIFNLKTTGLTTGTYNLSFTVGGDTVLYTVPFQVK